VKKLTFDYYSFALYASRGENEPSLRSKRLCAGIKRGSSNIIKKAVEIIESPTQENSIFKECLHPSVILVPAPKSSPLLNNDTLWVPKLICEELLSSGLAESVMPLLTRTEKVPKSAWASPGERPTVQKHLETIEAQTDMLSTREITIVDDVITKGSTMLACAIKLQENYPNAQVRCFSLFRTVGFQGNIDSVSEPTKGTIELLPSGEPKRAP